MSQKVSLWALVGVAAIALMLMANISTSITGEVTGPRPPRATPALRPPLERPVLVDRPDTVVVDSTRDDAALSAMADQMARIEKHQCYLINFQLDRDAGKNTPAELISKTCPRWV